MSFSQTIIQGHLGQDPEVRHTQSQIPVATISVATTDKWTDSSGEKQERTEWHRVTLWNKQAEFAGKYLKKGANVLVHGKNETREWEDKEGVKRYTTEIRARDIQSLDRREGSAGNKGGAPHPADTNEPPF